MIRRIKEHHPPPNQYHHAGEMISMQGLIARIHMRPRWQRRPYSRLPGRLILAVHPHSVCLVLPLRLFVYLSDHTTNSPIASLLYHSRHFQDIVPFCSVPCIHFFRPLFIAVVGSTTLNHAYDVQRIMYSLVVEWRRIDQRCGRSVAMKGDTRRLSVKVLAMYVG